MLIDINKGCIPLEISYAKRKIRFLRGYTLVEALFTIAILAMVLVAMIPFIRTVHTSWNLGDRKTELQQNGRVGMEMISRLLRQAKRITGIPNTGSGNFVKFRNTSDNQTTIFYHNIPSSAYSIGNFSLIHENDLVMRTINITGAVNNALLARSLNNFTVDFKNASGQNATKPYDVYAMNITMSLSDPADFIPDVIDVFSSVSLRPGVRINKPVWVGSTSNVTELSMDSLVAGFSSPASVSVNNNTGECWVADTGNNRVKKLSATGSVLLSLTGSAPSMSAPSSVSVNNSTGECWVADTGGSRIRKFSSSGSQTVNTQVSKPKFNAPRTVSVNPNVDPASGQSGVCWVADTGNNLIRKLSSTGTILLDIPGSSPAFSGPRSVSVNTSTGACWVADTGNSRVREFASNGTSILNLTGFNAPRSVSVNSSDNSCWVADTNNSLIKKLSSAGTVLLNLTGFNAPQSVSVNSSDSSCWVADTNNNQVVKLDSEGNEEFRISDFTGPLSVAASP